MAKPQKISAAPTKSFFVEMFTKDIPLEQAILDLVDNCIDGAKRDEKEGDLPYDGKEVRITFGEDEFRIIDNCGGFSTEIAREYAFRFGRPDKKNAISHSIGQFGVGMKRALFKFGDHFAVHSATSDETWAVDVDVNDWKKDDGDWTFEWKKFAPDADISKIKPGTEIWVTDLHRQVSRTFKTALFEQQIKNLVKSRHRNFLRKGLKIDVNGETLTPISLQIASSEEIKPAVKIWRIKDKKAADVRVSIIAGVGPSSPKLAGWYVVCNGRLILDADRRDVTGWGIVEELGEKKIVIPGYHNQFARFRGIVTFDSTDSSRVPWNTMKTDVDQDSAVWQEARDEMILLMRPVVDFLNELDADIDDYTRKHSPLFHLVEAANTVAPESFKKSRNFLAPERDEYEPVEKYIKIQFEREESVVEKMKKLLGVRSAKAAGERCFDQIYTQHIK